MTDAFHVPNRILMGPGPSDVAPRVLAAMAQPTIGHMDPAFMALMADISAQLRTVFRTKNEMTMAMSGTGSAGMETLFANLVEPGDKVLVCVKGVFGTRMVDVAERCRAEVHRIDRPWGQVFPVEEILAAADRVKPKMVAIVHAETSTGAHQPLEGLGAALRERGALLLVDGVTSLGGAPVEIDAWQIDAAYSGTQKCLSCPPGLAPVTLGPRAVARLEARKSKVQSWYLDLSMIRKYWGSDRLYHHTAPVNMLYGLHEALRIVLEEGLDARWARHLAMHKRLRAGLEAMGLKYVSQEGHHLPMLNAIGVPAGIEDAAGRKRLLEEYGIEIGAGLGDFKGKAWRIGIMGQGADARHVELILAALRSMLAKG
jgi:alanine-glyoxylate transaminase/serine-glyoxylate transaminase/serine-pyruvate transaminase